MTVAYVSVCFWRGGRRRFIKLSVAFSATKTCCVINDKSVNHVFYADDLCIMSASPAGLQKLIDICYNYSVPNSLTLTLLNLFVWYSSQRSLSCIVLPWF